MLEKLENRQALFVCLIKACTKEVFFYFEPELLRTPPPWFAFWQQRAERGWLMMNLILSPHIPALFMKYFTDTDCQEQNLSTHGHIFITCKQWLKICFNRTRNGVEKQQQPTQLLWCVPMFIQFLPRGSHGTSSVQPPLQSGLVVGEGLINTGK